MEYIHRRRNNIAATQLPVNILFDETYERWHGPTSKSKEIFLLVEIDGTYLVERKTRGATDFKAFVRLEDAVGYLTDFGLDEKEIDESIRKVIPGWVSDDDH